MTDVTPGGTIRLEQSLADRIAAARAQLAAEREQAGSPVDSKKVEHFTWLFAKLFGETALADLQATVEWRDQPVAVFAVGSTECVVKGVMETTGHTSWRVNQIELFKQKYAPPPDEAMNSLIMALAKATEEE